MATVTTNAERKDEIKNNKDEDEEVYDADIITVGRLVEVASRTWPGINKPGGVARVVEVHFDAEDETNDKEGMGNDPERKNPTHVNVRYMVGSSREKRVPIEYVKLAPQYETTTTNNVSNADSGQSERCNYVASSLRDRSMLLGRCKRCGSLRMDCGSCDWALEEETASSSRPKATAIPREKHLAKKRKKHAKKRRAGNSLPSDDDSDVSSHSSNDDEDEYDLARLRKLILRSKKQSLEIKRYGKSGAMGKWQQKYPVLIDDYSSSSSNSSESEPDESTNSKFGGRAMEKGKLQTKRRYYTGGQSILESLPAMRQVDDRKKKHPKSKIQSSKSASKSKSVTKFLLKDLAQKSNSLETSSSSDSGMDEIPLTSFFDDRKRKKRLTSSGMRSGEALVDIPLNTANNSRRTVNDTEAQEDSYNRQLLELEARARLQIERQQQSSGDANAGNDEDEGFIQPEGQEAVENLPDDMVDISRNVPYKDLGPLFDSIATKLEDEILPDFKLKMAGLHHKLKDQQKQQQYVLNTTNTCSSMKVLLEEYHSLWEEVRTSIVRNGTDQCRATLRRLMDDRLYRKHKKKLTTEERKRNRGPGIMDARNLRMDAMDDSVESFIRKLKEAVVACEKECERISLLDTGIDKEKDDSTNDDAYCDNDVSSEEENNLSPNTAMISYDQAEMEFAPFRPHQHASRVRKEKSVQVPSESKKSSSKSNPNKKSFQSSRKRPRTTNSNTSEISPRSKTRASRSLASQVNTKATESEGGNRSIKMSTGEFFETEISYIHPSVESARTDTAVTSIRHEARNREIGSRERRKRREAQLYLPEPRDSKQSISERMQAFLDANEANGMRGCSEDEGAGALSKGTRRQTNNHGRHRRKCSIFEPKPRRKGMQSDEPEYEDHVDINEHGEMEVEQEKAQFYAFDTQSFFDQLSSTIRHCEESTKTLNDEDSSNIDRKWDELLSEMEMALSNNPESMNIFLQKSYNILICRGSRTLQDVIASKETELSLHIRTLSLCVRSLKYVSNDDIPIVFKKENHRMFLDFLVLQLVDALYSLILPTAWARENENCKRMFHELIPLRNELASCIPLVEAVSQCIVKSFECQQWRKIPNKKHVFVSSLNPKCWSNFLERGTDFENPQVTRFHKLGRFWPRIEVDALWRILAFVGAAPSVPTDKSIFRLQIISKLFSSGVLAAATDGKEGKLPPSEDQLLACQQEIRYFSALLRKGVLDSMPKTDSMLVKLVQHSLQLQVDSFEGSPHARASCFPDSGDETWAKKTASMFWRNTHPLYFNSNKENYRCVPIAQLTFDKFHEKNEKAYKMLLYPTSDSLLSCLSLVISWINRISVKKIRQNRLVNSLKSLQNELLKEKSKQSEQPVKKVDVTFEAACSQQASVEVGNGSERATVFRLEAASYLRIITSMCMKNKIDTDFSKSIWKTISDDQMKRRQCDIAGLRSDSEKYRGDAYLLFATTKIMAILLFVQMNVSPWHLSLGASVTRPFADNRQMSNESYSFPLSCIFACLDCICDLEVGPQVFSKLYEIIILIFRNLGATDIRGDSSLASDSLRSKCISNFTPVLMRCIKLHIGSSSGSQQTFHLGLCLSSIRAIHSFVATHDDRTELASASISEAAGNQSRNVFGDENSEDMWGDLDDSDFAALDLACISGCQDEMQQRDNIWELLSDALEQSKPSKRFAILRNADLISGSDFHLSSVGKHLVTEEVDKICDCFSAAMASIRTQDVGSSKISKIVLKWSKLSDENDEDCQFVSRIQRKLTFELCSLSEKYPPCRSFVAEHCNDMLFNFFKALVDSSRLEKLPSCNLERIGESSGRAGTEQAILMLDLFNDDSFQDIDNFRQGKALRKLQNRRRKSVTEIWEFCFKIGTAFAKNDERNAASITAIGNSLINLDNDLLQEFTFSDDVISLETETFKMFRLLRNILSYSATKCANFVAFENVSSGLIVLFANNILGIAQSLKYNDQTSSDKEYKKAKLTELLSSFVELFVSSVAWILQEGAKNRSKAWCFLQNYLRDRLLSPILRKQPIDTTIALQEIIAAARFVHAGPHREGVSLPAIHCVGLVGCSKYLGDCFFASVLRRSKQLIVATAFNPQNLGLQNAIIEAVLWCADELNEAGPWIVGSTFPLGKSRCIRNERVSWPYSSPIQKQIDEYLEFVDQNLGSLNRKNNADWWNSLVATKTSFLKNQIIPRLQSVSLGIEKKRRIVMLLSYILEHDVPRPVVRSNDLVPRARTMDIRIVREIIKALRFNFHKSFMQFSVDNDLVRYIFSCSIHVANFRLLLDETEQNLVGWSRAKIVASKGKTMLDLSNLEVFGSYVWVFFQWLRTFGELVIDQTDDHSERLSSIRRHWNETQCCRLGGLDEESLDLESSHSFETWDSLLIDFEDLAMPSKKQSNKNPIVKNIYAKPQQQDESNNESSSLLEPWKPSSSVKKNLKELLAAILTAS